MDSPKKKLLFLLPLLLLPMATAQSSNPPGTPIPFEVGVLLDTSIPVAVTGNISISIAIEDFYSQHKDYTTRLVLHIRDTGNSTVRAASAALNLLRKEKVQAIVGPQTSAQAVFIAELGNATQVPIVSFSATSPTLTSSPSPYFVRAASSDSSQLNAISSLAEAFGWRQAVPIYEDTNFGVGIVPYLIDALQGVNTRVPYRSVLPLDATDGRILEELYKLMTMQTRVFVVHMSPALGSRLFLKAWEIGMMGKGYVWIITNSMTNYLDLMDSSTIRAMEGVIGVKHYIRPSKKFDDFSRKFSRKYLQEYLNVRGAAPGIYGAWAYDAIWALAMAVEKSKSGLISRNQSSAEQPRSIIELKDLPLSSDGPRLRDALLNVRFGGVSGEFHLVDRQLRSSEFEIINVNGNGRVIGYWSPSHGISRTPPTTDRKMYSASAADLGVVIWPGESTSVPRGWQTPTSGKVLRIGVPTRVGFDEFIKVEHDTATNQTRVTGYCIDVFQAVVQKLPYALQYEFIPFEKSNGEMAGDYNTLVESVDRNEFDAVVGDTTITMDRSKFVDFTLPYTESGVAMIVPVRRDRNRNTWTFLKPLSWDLWLAILAFFAFSGFVVWVIEREDNEEFKGPFYDQFGIVLYFTFSTMVFSHNENVKSNCSRAVVIVWIFVVLILSSSYTANLTSILTVAKLEPTVRDMEQLAKNGDVIGYHKGSFVKEFLRKSFDGRMVALDSPEAYVEALDNGRVSVVFHEIPYIRLFLSKYCSGYTMSDPTHKTAGFGFAFPRGSRLVPDISRAILNFTVGDEYARLEKKWFGDSCANQDSSIDPNTLTFPGFWVLFAITGGTSVVAVAVSVAIFLWKEWDQLRDIARVQPTKSAMIDGWLKHYVAFDKGEDIAESTHGIGAGVVPDGCRTPQSNFDQSVDGANSIEEGIVFQDSR